MPGNEQVLRIARLAYNCIRYITGMGGAVVAGYDWPAIEALCRMSKINIKPLTVTKLRRMEDLLIKYGNKKDGGKNGR